MEWRTARRPVRWRAGYGCSRAGLWRQYSVPPGIAEDRPCASPTGLDRGGVLGASLAWLKCYVLRILHLRSTHSRKLQHAVLALIHRWRWLALCATEA